MTTLSELQRKLKACEQSKKNIIANQSSYTKTSTYTLPGRESFKQIVVPYEEMKHIWTPDGRHPPDWPRPYLGDEDGRLAAFIAQKVGNSAIRVPKQGAYNNTCYGFPAISYYLNDYGQQPPSGSRYHGAEQWNGTVKLYYYVRGQETRTKTEFDSAAYNSALSSAEWQIDQVQQQINAENARIKQEQALIAKQKVEQEQKEITAKITSMTMEARMDLFVETFDKKDNLSQFTIEKIKSMGLSADYLAHLAIQKNNEELFDFSIKEGANFNSYFVEGKTLLQHAIHSQNESLITKALAKCNNLAYTAISALEQDDELTITKLLSHDANLLQAKYAFYDSVTNAYSLLQIAIMEEKPIPLINKILELENDSMSILSDNGKSAFKFACESGRSEIIEILAQHIDISQEINQLADYISANFKAKIVERNDIDTLIKLLKGDEVREAEYLESVPDIEEELILNNVECSEADIMMNNLSLAGEVDEF